MITTHARDRARLIAIGIPSLGRISLWTAHAVMSLQFPMNRSSYDRFIGVIGRDVADARNEIVEQALAVGKDGGDIVSHIFFVDDDVIPSRSALTQLYARDLPIVSGYYYTKADPPQPLILGEKHAGTIDSFQPDTVLPVYAHGMGCTLIAREVFEAISRPWFRTVENEPISMDTRALQSMTEDVFFCEQSADAGFQPHVDTGVFCFHWDHRIGEAYPRDTWADYQEGRPWQTPGHTVVSSAEVLV